MQIQIHLVNQNKIAIRTYTIILYNAFSNNYSNTIYWISYHSL